MERLIAVLHAVVSGRWRGDLRAHLPLAGLMAALWIGSLLAAAVVHADLRRLVSAEAGESRAADAATLVVGAPAATALPQRGE